jgi:nanoRNase/pAp phosphatase (c-di-AMP/oligoRNAs hydrolase)
MNNKDLLELQNLLKTKSNILIASHTRPTIDSVSAIILLYKLLTLIYKDKKITIYLPSLPARLEFLMKVVSDGIPIIKVLEESKYTISIPKQKALIDTINYLPDDDNFTLNIKLLKGDIDKDSVKVSKIGFTYDLVILIDTPYLKFTGNLSKAIVPVRDSISIVNIDSHPDNSHYGDCNISKDKFSTSQVLFELSNDLKLNFDKEYLNLILIAILYKTDGLKASNIPFDVFKDISSLVSLGANMSYAIRCISGSFDLQDLKVKESVIRNAQEGNIDNAKYVRSSIDGILSNPCGLLETLYIRGINFAFILSIVDKKVKVYAKFFTYDPGVGNLSKTFDDIKFEGSVYTFNTNKSPDEVSKILSSLMH